MPINLYQLDLRVASAIPQSVKRLNAKYLGMGRLGGE